MDLLAMTLSVPRVMDTRTILVTLVARSQRPIAQLLRTASMPEESRVVRPHGRQRSLQPYAGRNVKQTYEKSGRFPAQLRLSVHRVKVGLRSPVAVRCLRCDPMTHDLTRVAVLAHDAGSRGRCAPARGGVSGRLS
jgi:hypothetical protein